MQTKINFSVNLFIHFIMYQKCELYTGSLLTGKRCLHHCNYKSDA